MHYPVTEIEGIGTGFARRLARAGIKNTGHLLARGADRKGRRDVAQRTGLDEKRILRWVNKADLMRIRGIGGQYADLLGSVGVQTMGELRNRNAENLAAKMKEKNRRRRRAKVTPSTRVVQSWVDAARTLPPIVTH